MIISDSNPRDQIFPGAWETHVTYSFLLRFEPPSYIVFFHNPDLTLFVSRKLGTHGQMIVLVHNHQLKFLFLLRVVCSKVRGRDAVLVSNFEAFVVHVGILDVTLDSKGL